MLTPDQIHEAEQSVDDLDDEKPERYASWCNHRFGDGSKAYRSVWTEKGFVGHCEICGEVIEQ